MAVLKPIQGYHFIKPEDLSWPPSNLMRIPNADYLECLGGRKMGRRGNAALPCRCGRAELPLCPFFLVTAFSG